MISKETQLFHGEIVGFTERESLLQMQDQSAGDNKYRLMTSVAKAALDSRDKAVRKSSNTVI